MNRLWSTGIALALFFCGGQASAVNNCQPFTTVTITPADNSISLVCPQTQGGTGWAVELTNASTDARKCNYTNNGQTPAIKIEAGNISKITANCLVSSVQSDPVFTISAAPITAIVGTPFDLKVKRTQGKYAFVLDELTVSNNSATAIAQFNPSTVSFAANELSGTERTFKVVFTQKGDGKGKLLVNSSPSGTSLSQDITVSSNTGGGTCANPVPPYAIDAGTATAGNAMGATHKLIAAAATERASGAIRFKVSATTVPLTFKLYSSSAGTEPATVPVDLAVSSCPGDFAGDFAPGNNRSKCKVSGTTQNGVTIGDAGCPVKADSSYYLNVRAITPGRDVTFKLTTQAP